MKTRIILLLLAFCLMNTGICMAEVVKEDFTVCDINLFTSRYEDIVAHLGRPYKEKVEEQGQPAYTYLTYPGLSLWTVNDTKKLVYIKIEGYDYHTKRGVKVGATAYKILKEYGQPQKKNLHGHMYFIYQINGEVTGKLAFDMTDGYASKIIFSALPDVP